MAEQGARPVLRMVPSRPRLALGTGILCLLGGLVLEVAVTGAFGFGARLMLLALASAAFLLAYALWRTGRLTLELDKEGLREAGPEGRVVARLEEIRSVDRGVFAFKPSSGFVLSLKRSAPAAWSPGLWWRIGRRVGVGGLVPAWQTKVVAEAITLELAREDAQRRD